MLSFQINGVSYFKVETASSDVLAFLCIVMIIISNTQNLL